MKYFLLPLTLILSYYISFYTTYLIVLLIPLLFSLGWIWFIFVWIFFQSIILSVIGGVATFIIDSLSNYYKNIFIAILYSITSVLGLFQVVMFFYENPPIMVVEGVDIPMFSGMWDASWLKTILTIWFFIPYLAIPLSLCLLPYFFYRLKHNPYNI